MAAKAPNSHPDAWTDARPIIAVLAGGFSPEHAISVQSGAEVVRHLAESRYRPVLVDVARPRWTAPQEGPDALVDLNDFSLLAGSKRRRFDGAFVALHGSPGEDGQLAGLLAMLQVPHTTVDTRSAALTFDKQHCKVAVAGSGVALAKGCLVKRSEGLVPAQKALEGWTYPLFVKPNRNGSSCGISKVIRPEDLPAALEAGWAFDEELLVEKAIEGGREVTCAVHTYAGEARILPICEIVSGKGHDFFDYTAKYTAGEAEEIVPARLDAEQAEQVRQCSLAIYRMLNLRGLVRIDYILADGQCWFLEVNAVPGLSGASLVPKMALSAGWTLASFFEHLIDEALHESAFARKVGF